MGRRGAGHQEGVRISAQPDPEGTPRTLAAIYRDHADFVWRVVMRLGISEAHAEDAVHEVFIVARKKLAQYRGDASESTWLFAIARGVCSNLRRSRGRRERKLAAVPPAADPEQPDEVVERIDAASLVDRFLCGLPAAQRDVFCMIDVDEMRGPDVARALGIPLGTVYSRLRLARARFEAFAREHGGGEA